MALSVSSQAAWKYRGKNDYLRTWQTDLGKKKQAKLLQMLFRRPPFLSPNMKINDERKTKIITSQTLAFRFVFSPSAMMVVAFA